MHSFNNGTSLTCKRDNWNQLLKFFSKRGVEPGGVAVTRAETEEIIHCRSDAIDKFINRTYEFLTGKKCVGGALRGGKLEANIRMLSCWQAPCRAICRRGSGAADVRAPDRCAHRPRDIP